MTWLALSMLFIQAVWVSSCVFDKVEKFLGGKESLETKYVNESRCFADCYENKYCVTIAYGKSKGLCVLYDGGSYSKACAKGSICYTLSRNEVDPMCQRYVDF
ncbi:unnamed protein product [Cylicocyclus nassatus]|uniref:Apple domain-containing protein n=1 Tax=Cylicocyclus nassatus TaxID=53992 RepID=A0AA36H132_CYLNA|nr:unnamed protein product [Cylicocyclus nassatus]